MERKLCLGVMPLRLVATGKMHGSFVGGKTHPTYKDIDEMLAKMSPRLRLQGYVANTKEVLFDIEKRRKMMPSPCIVRSWPLLWPGRVTGRPGD
uniref:Uncharacterized protein n=1 Tax=Leersia perrieri TaxID=77586 RepID=A0A0D9V4Y4_9ORYZ